MRFIRIIAAVQCTCNGVYFTCLALTLVLFLGLSRGAPYACFFYASVFAKCCAKDTETHEEAQFSYSDRGFETLTE